MGSGFRHNSCCRREPYIKFCSTPYGINGFGTIVRTTSQAIAMKCSTPYGIKGFGTSVYIKPLANRVSCSTPYGIKGFGTCCCHFVSNNVDVLNALRHQRFWHQRRSFDPQSRQCAQRLTASKVLAPLLAHLRNPCLQVLNALRHQRFWHSRLLRVAGLFLRAQRLTASKVLAQIPRRARL